MKYSININDKLHSIFEDFNDGHIDALDALTYAKQLKDLASAIESNEDIKNGAITEIDRYAKEEQIVRADYSITTRNSTRYEYDFPYYNKIKKETGDTLRRLEEAAKIAMKMPNGVLMFPNEDGEVVEVKAAIPSHGTSVIFKKL